MDTLVQEGYRCGIWELLGVGGIWGGGEYAGHVRHSTPVCERFRHDALHEFLGFFSLYEANLTDLQTLSPF